MKRREAWRENQDKLDRDRFVFIDETWASTNMARTHGRCPRGERLRASVPHGHWKTTCVATLATRGIIVPWVLNAPINRDAFETYVEKVLVPELPDHAIVVMDLSSHKGPRIREMIEAAGLRSSIFRPAAPTSTRSKTPSASSRQICEKAPNAPSAAFGMLSGASSTTYTPADSANYFAAAGYLQPDRLTL